MATVLLTVAALTDLGIATSGGVAPDVTDGVSFPNDGATFLSIINGGGAPITVTELLLGTKNNIDGLIPVNRAVSIAAAETKLIGPFPPSAYNDANMLVKCTFSAIATVTVKALRVTSLSGQ